MPFKNEINIPIVNESDFDNEQEKVLSEIVQGFDYLDFKPTLEEKKLYSLDLTKVNIVKISSVLKQSLKRIN